MVVAAQMYIFSKMADRDGQTADILRGLSEAGYEAVEGGNGYPTRAAAQQAGIAFGAAHLIPQDLETLEPLCDFLRSMDARHVCSSGPLKWHERTADDYRKTAAFLNEKGRLLRQQGIGLHYHNHEFEFAEIEGGQTAMDVLLAELNPDCVSLCFDAGWAQQGGQDAAQFMRQNASRIAFLHLRDFRGAQSVPLGQGDLDLQAQIAVLPALPNLEFLVIEQDPSETPLADMQASRRYLRDTFGF